MQQNDEHLRFVKQKIECIKIAFFIADTESILKLPNNIISTLRVTDDGFIWFFTSYIGEYIQYLDKEFYVSLDYYQKGNNCRLQIKGKAFIIDNDTEEPLGMKDTIERSAKMILMKVKILKAEYTVDKLPRTSIKEKIVSAFHTILSSNQYKVYDFS